MNIPPDFSNAMGRVQEIQQRIATITGGSAAPGKSFDDALQTATNAANDPPRSLPAAGVPPAVPTQLLDPTGEIIRPVPQSGSDYETFVQQSAAKYGVDPGLIRAVIQTESSGNTHAVSRAGAIGLMQLMPANVSEAGVGDPFDPQQNIDAGTHQLADLLSRYNGNMDMALAAYNAGPGAVSKYGGVPPYPETQQYIAKIKRQLEAK